MPESKASQGERQNRVVNKRTLNAIREKRKRWKNTNITKMLIIGITIKLPECGNDVTSELRLARYLFEKGLASKIKGGDKQFWKYVCLKTKTVTKVNRFKGQDATLTLNDSETATVLNDFFASVFEKEGDGNYRFSPNNNMPNN